MNFKLAIVIGWLMILGLGDTVFGQFGATSKDAPAIARRAADDTVETMLLGTYHFNNPGADELNTEVDDYFSDQRQKEMAEVVKQLAKFRPTKIYVEVLPEYQELIDERYSAFVKGELDLKELRNGRSETYQLGFRIAKACDLPGVNCVDAPGAWLGRNVNETADELMPEFYSKVREVMVERNEEENERLLANSIRENLIAMNETRSIMANHSYYNQLSTLVADPSKPAGIEFDEKEVEDTTYMMIGVEQQNIGAELVGKWYTRNIKIFSNMIRSIEKDDERILVIFGQGHIRPIQHFFEDHPTFELVSPIDYLNEK